MAHIKRIAFPDVSPDLDAIGNERLATRGTGWAHVRGKQLQDTAFQNLVRCPKAHSLINYMRSIGLSHRHNVHAVSIKSAFNIA